MSEPDEVCDACGAEVFDIDVRCSACGEELTSEGARRMIGGVVLEHYEIIDILGQGGMSVVYKGKHNLTGQEVALKLLPPELAAYRDVKDRFLEEGRALAQLDHPNIVHLYNFGDDGDCLVLAMQFVRGVTWERLILEQDRLSWRRSAQLTIDVSNALDYAHGRGIIHRDMKPSNVLIRDLDGAATVMDFGIAKVQSSAKLTATGQTMGTVRYMSPEQVRGKTVDVRTDIYSLAMTTYESLVGDTPYTGETHFEIMTKHLNEQPIPPSKHGIDLPPAFEAVLMRAISKRPEDRQSSAGEFKEQLEAVLAGEAPVLKSSVAGDTDSGGKKTVAHRPPKSETPDRELAATLTGRDPQLDFDAHAGKSRLSIAVVGVAVLAGAIAAFVLTRSEPGGASRAAPAAGAGATMDAATESNAQKLAEAFTLPGLSFAVDRTYSEDNLRVLSVAERSTEELRAMVLSARQGYKSVSEQEGWPLAEISLPLTIVIVPQSALCNPGLYESGRVDERCQEQDAWYRPVEHSLYLAPPEGAGLESLVSYWVAMATCIHGAVPDCTDVIQEKLGR